MNSGDGRNGGNGGFIITARARGFIMSLAAFLVAATTIWQSSGYIVEAMPWATRAELEATRSEVIVLAGEVIKLKKRELRSAKVVNQRQRYDNLEQRQKYEEEGKPVPRTLLEDAEDLEAEKQDIEEQIDELEASEKALSRQP